MTALISHLRCLFLHIDSGAEDSRNLNVLSFLETVALVSKCPLRHIASKWIDSVELTSLMDGLKLDVSDSERRVLLVSGSNLEDQVTVCALEALVEGFDVHMLCDFVSAHDAKLKSVLLLRLFQAGAVPSSLRQFLYMWQAAEGNNSEIESFKKLLAEYDKNYLRHPR